MAFAGQSYPALQKNKCTATNAVGCRAFVLLLRREEVLRVRLPLSCGWRGAKRIRQGWSLR